jgi:hypothetical protein
LVPLYILYSKAYVLAEKPSRFAGHTHAGYPPGRSRSEGALVGRRERRNRSQVRAEGRVRARVQQRGGAGRGDAKRGAGDPTRKKNTLDLGAIEGYASRLAGRTGGASGLAGAASGLAGAASGFAGGSFAHRLISGDTSMPEEEFRREIAEHIALLEERLQRLEERVSAKQDEVEEGLPEPEGETNPGGEP